MNEPKLYEIPRIFDEAMMAGFDPETGEVTDALKAELDGLDMAFDDLALVCRDSIKRQEAIVLTAQAEIDRCTNIKKRAENKIKGVTGYLDVCMRSMGRTSIGDDIRGVKFKKLPTMLDPDSIDMSILPEPYRVYKPAPEPTPDKKALLKDYKAGTLPDIEGLKFLEGRTKLVIK